MRTSFGEAALVQRFEVHKTPNILEYLREQDRPWAQPILRRAHEETEVKPARRLLLDLARRLEAESPSGAERVREGLDETLNRPHADAVGAAAALTGVHQRRRESHQPYGLVTRNLKRWRGGQMMLRRVHAGILEAVTGFRRLKGSADMPTLVSALRARDRQLGFVTTEEDRQVA